MSVLKKLLYAASGAVFCALMFAVGPVPAQAAIRVGAAVSSTPRESGAFTFELEKLTEYTYLPDDYNYKTAPASGVTYRVCNISDKSVVETGKATGSDGGFTLKAGQYAEIEADEKQSWIVSSLGSPASWYLGGLAAKGAAAKMEKRGGNAMLFYPENIKHEDPVVPGPHWFWFGSSGTLVLKENSIAPEGYGAVTDSGKGLPSGMTSSSYSGGWAKHREQISKVVVLDKIKVPGSMADWFYYATHLTALTGLEKLDTSDVTNMHSMFQGCSALTSLPDSIGNWDTGNVTDMSDMFFQCSDFTSLPSSIGRWNTANVMNMSRMFYDCKALMSMPSSIGSWNTANVTKMYGIFSDCSSLTSLPESIGNWDTANVTDMDFMFAHLEALTSLPESIGKWNTANVTDMSGMFYECSKVTNWSVINKWNVNKVTSHNAVFYRCTPPLPTWGGTTWK